MTAIDIIEYQANYCAAAFLMPKEAVINTFADTKNIGERASNRGIYRIEWSNYESIDI